jgi:multidrug resistance efflux pump
MTDQAYHSSKANSLKVSKVSWGRLFGILRGALLVTVAAAATALYMSGGSLQLRANGMVTRERVRVASPFEARIAEIFVHPGDYVQANQKIARVESGTVVRTLTDIAAERAKLASRVAQLNTRMNLISSILPVAQTSERQAEEFLQVLLRAKERGLSVSRSTQEISASYVIAADKAAGLTAERESLGPELGANRDALEEAEKAFASLRRAYNDGVLVAPSEGIVGPAMGVVGQVLTGENSITDIYIGSNYVLAYIPDDYLLDVYEGQLVCARTGTGAFNARIESILPVTETLPSEFQLPVKVRERGQLAKINLVEDPPLAIGQKIVVTARITSDCRMGLAGLMRQGFLSVKSFIELAASKVLSPFNAQANQRG